MTARHKLNGASINGALIVAGLVGLFRQSPAIFVIALVALVATSVISREIR